MATVWRAVHEGHGHPVAIKVMIGEQARKQRFVDSFHREVRAVARMNHPNIVRVFDYGAINPQMAKATGGELVAGCPYMVMELADSTLAKLDHSRLRWAHVHTVLGQILDALAHSHARDLVHRDLKPDNVLFVSIDGDAQIKLSDFGVVYSINAMRQLRPEDQIITGTPRYMAPEQIRGRIRDQGPWTDLYALGCLAFWLSTGTPPFSAPTIDETLRCHLNKSRPALEPVLTVPVGFDDWVHRLLAREPAQRFRRAADAADALENIAGEPSSNEMTIAAQSDDGQPVELTLLEEPDATWVIDAPPAMAESSEDGDERAMGSGSVHAAPDLPKSWRDEPQMTDSIEWVGVGLNLFELREIPLVGRHEQRDLLWDTLVDARYTGRPHVVVLDGPAGIGKTRLATWLARRAHQAGAVEVLTARHSPISGPADGIDRMFANHLRCVGLSRPQIWERLREEYAIDGALDDDDSHQCLALTDLITPGADPEFDADAMTIQFGSTEERYLVWTRFLARLCERRPLLLVLDDIHWGSNTLDFVRDLIDASTEMELPLLVVMTSRDDLLDERPVAARILREILDQPCTHHASLGPLDADEHLELVENLLRLEPQLAGRVARRTAGNPLFASQLVGDWIERDMLTVGENGFRLVGDGEKLLPQDIRALLVQRLEVLTGQSTDAVLGPALWSLELASVLGQSVEHREWLRLCEMNGIEPPDDLLEVLAGQALVRIGQRSWTFVHGSLRETLLEVAGEHGRFEAHHKKCAAMLRELYDTSREDRSPRLARHLLKAGDFEDALGPIYRGFRYYLRRCDFDAAKGFYEMHRKTRRRLGLGRGDRRCIETDMQWARMHNRRRNLSQAADLLVECQQHAKSHGHLDLVAQIHLQRVVVMRASGQRDTRGELELLDRAQDYFEKVDDEEGLARTMLERGWSLMDKNDNEQAKELFEEAWRRFESVGEEAPISRCIYSLATTHNNLGNWERAVDLFQQAREKFEEQGARLWVGHCYNGLGEILRRQGQFARAEPMYQQAVAISRQTGIESNNTIPYYNLGFMMLQKGDFSAARSYMEKSLKSEQSLRRPPFLGLAHAGIAVSCSGCGEWNEFDEHLEKAHNYFADNAFAERDLALAYEIAFEQARRHGEDQRGLWVCNMAVEQWRELGETERVEALESTLASAPSIED